MSGLMQPPSLDELMHAPSRKRVPLRLRLLPPVGRGSARLRRRVERQELEASSAGEE